jgi:hypothetical protein
MPTDALDLSITVADDCVTLTTPHGTYEGGALGEDALRELERLRQSAEPRAYGTALFDALFVDDLRDGYRTTLEPRDAEARVRLDVKASAPALSAVCWEALTAPGPPPLFFAHSYRTPFSRKPAGSPPAQEPPPITDEKLRVLVVISNPTDVEEAWRLPRADESAMLEAVEAAMAPLGDRIDYEIQTTPASVGRIRERLTGEAFHVLHVFSHGAFADGDDEPCLLLEREDETAVSVGDDELAELVMDLRDLRLVVLASCPTRPGPAGAQLAQPSGQAFEGLVPRMIEYGLPAVVAMRDCVDVDVASLFTETFYNNLGTSRSGRVDEVINLTRDNVRYRRQRTWDWTVPVLFMSGEGMLLKSPGAEAGAQRQSLAARKPAVAVAGSGRRMESRIAPPKPPTAQLSHEGKLVPEDRPDLHLRTVLIHELAELDLNDHERSQILRELRIDPSHIDAPTDYGRRVRLVDFVLATDTVPALRGGMQAIQKTRTRSAQGAEIYDLGDRRAALRGAQY